MADEVSNALPERQRIVPINIEDEMRVAYIDYSMSVIVSRALPDVRDGLKPVHRRVLYGMQDLGVAHNKPHKKSARIVGEVLGKYHPHGDSSVYDTMVRMAQDWSLRYTLVDGQGNFGSIDGDFAAAMRYTEARLQKLAEEMLADIKKETVDFQPNFDESLTEPVVLPAKIPNLLINGSSGIAVGMATNIAPHNLSEVVDGTIAYINDNDITIDALMHFIKAPDFPTGGIIYGYQGVKDGFEQGRGRIVVRGKAEIVVNDKGRDQIVVTEIPYMVNKAQMISRTAALVNEKKIEGIVDIRDESDREGYRVVYDLKKGSIPNIVLNNLYKHTQLQSSFGVNNVALVKGRPKTLTLKNLIVHFVDHRHEVVVRRTQYDLREAEKRAHILEGYLIALNNLDEVIALIRKAKDPDTAKAGLIEKFRFSAIQAKAILELRLQRLTGMERQKIETEYEALKKLITHLMEVLASISMRMNIIKEELLEVKEQYGDQRRTEIVHSDEDFTMEDMIPNEDMVITISNQGYIKRTSLSEYRTQGRGGVGSRAVTTKEDDFTAHLFIARAHHYLLIFTSFGKVYWKKVYEIPEGGKTTKGRAIQNLLNIESGDTVRSVLNTKNLSDETYINSNFVMFCTQKGCIKKTRLEAYSRPRTNGITAITINEGDKLLDVAFTHGDNHILIAKREGKAIHFHESNVRAMGRTAAGVRGVMLESATDRVVGMICIDKENTDVLVIAEKGYGKRSSIKDYRITRRGAKGVKTINITEKTGKLVAVKEVQEEDQLMIINRSGISIRIKVADLRVMQRATQGVKVIRLNKNDAISSVAKIQTVTPENNSLDEKENENNQSKDF